jgi:AraC-like DNA-binding protein
MFFETDRDKRAYFCKRDNVCAAHFHRSPEILYVLSGEKSVIVGGEKLILKENDLLLCPPYTAHAFMPSPNGEQFVAAIPAEYCLRFEEYCRTHTPASYALSDEDGSFFKLFSALKEADNEVLYEGIINTIFGLYMKKSAFLPVKKTPDRSEVNKIAEYIDEHYAEELSLKRLAKTFGYSPNYFSTLFKKYFQAGVTQYINAVRVQKSLSFLKAQKISAVYFLCGFKSPQQYFLNFRRFFGCTPYEYLHAEQRVFP